MFLVALVGMKRMSLARSATSWALPARIFFEIYGDLDAVIEGGWRGGVFWRYRRAAVRSSPSAMERAWRTEMASFSFNMKPPERRTEPIT